MPELKDVFYEILVSHNHEIVMASDWLALLAEELAEAAQHSEHLTDGSLRDFLASATPEQLSAIKDLLSPPIGK